jgi:hypothetical protein
MARPAPRPSVTIMMTTTRTRSIPQQASGDGSRIPLYRNPLRLAASASPWRSARYLAGHLAGGTTLAAASALVTAAGAAAAATVAGISLLRPAAGGIRACADAERRRLRLIWPEPVRAAYAPDCRPYHGRYRGQAGLARAVARWRDPVLWRDLGYLIALWLPLALLDVTVLSVWAALLAGITLPFWYWLPRGTEAVGYVHGGTVHGLPIGYFPHGPTGPGGIGLYADTMPRAVLAAALSGVLFLLFNYLLVRAARAHAGAARALLGPSRARVPGRA